MKLKASQVDGFVSRPDPAVRIVLVHGPDRGLAEERIRKMVKHYLGEEHDPMSLVSMESQDLSEDPARLMDEVCQISMFGGRRLIRVTGGGAAVARAVGAVLDEAPGSDTIVIIDGGDPNPSDKLRKLCETDKAAVALPCYADDVRGLDRLIGSALGEHGYTIDPDGRALLVECLGSDRGMNQQTLRKLCLYKGDEPGPITRHDVEEAVADQSAVGWDDVAFETFDGNLDKALSLLDKVVAEKTAGVVILMSLQRHADRLRTGRDAVDRGTQPDKVLASLRVHFSRKARFRNQMARWRPELLDRASGMILDTEIDAKSGLYDDTLITRQLVLRLGNAARAAGRRR